jgi:hypothetical protein
VNLSWQDIISSPEQSLGPVPLSRVSSAHTRQKAGESVLMWIRVEFGHPLSSFRWMRRYVLSHGINAASFVFPEGNNSYYFLLRANPPCSVQCTGLDVNLTVGASLPINHTLYLMQPTVSQLQAHKLFHLLKDT